MSFPVRQLRSFPGRHSAQTREAALEAQVDGLVWFITSDSNLSCPRSSFLFFLLRAEHLSKQLIF